MCSLTQISTKEWGPTWRKGESRGLQKTWCRCSARVLPFDCGRVTHFPVWSCEHGVSHWGIKSDWLNGILSNILVILPELSHKSISSFLASPPIQSAVCVLSHIGFCSLVRVSPQLCTVADSQGQAAKPYFSRFVFKCTKWTFSNGAVFLL